jgi:hypothetical protein
LDNYDPWAPACNASRSWEKDELGRWKYVGLSFEESEALKEWYGVRLCGDDIVYPLSPLRNAASGEYLEQMRLLSKKHEERRRALLGEVPKT